MIKNIIFDIGGVLVDFNPIKTLREMNLPEDEVQSIARTTVLGPHWKELDRGIISKHDVFEIMLADTQPEYRKDARNFLENQILNTVTSFDYSADWLKSLKEENLKVYLLTNYPDWMFDFHFKNTFTFSSYTDGKIVSGKVKLIKPDPQIYRTLLETYCLNPEECLFIDDRQENILAAQKLDINGIWFDEYEKVKEKLQKLLTDKE